MRELKAKGAHLRATEQPGGAPPPVSASLICLEIFTKFETNLKHERQMEGIAKAKANHVYKGRKASMGRHQGVGVCLWRRV